MNFYECNNFESLTYTRDRRYQEKESMVFLYSNVPGVNISHCYISSPKNRDFFNLDLYPNLKIHTRGVHDLLSDPESRALSRLLKKHSGRGIEQYGLGLFGKNQVHFFAQPKMIPRIATYFNVQEQVLGDLAFIDKWNQQESRIKKLIGHVENDDIDVQFELCKELDSADNWRDVIDEQDRPFIWLWLHVLTTQRKGIKKANIHALEIVKRLEWVNFYKSFILPFFSSRTKDAHIIEYVAKRASIASDFKKLYPFLAWDFPLDKGTG